MRAVRAAPGWVIVGCCGHQFVRCAMSACRETWHDPPHAAGEQWGPDGEAADAGRAKPGIRLGESEAPRQREVTKRGLTCQIDYGAPRTVSFQVQPPAMTLK